MLSLNARVLLLGKHLYRGAMPAHVTLHEQIMLPLWHADPFCMTKAVHAD